MKTKPAIARLSLNFDIGELNFYACSVTVPDQKLDEFDDWMADVMSPV